MGSVLPLDDPNVNEPVFGVEPLNPKALGCALGAPNGDGEGAWPVTLDCTGAEPRFPKLNVFFWACEEFPAVGFAVANVKPPFGAPNGEGFDPDAEAPDFGANGFEG